MSWYYISFATETEFLGATVVEGVSETQALEIATNNALNPGGQAAIIFVPDSLLTADDVEPLKYKLFNKEQMKALGAKRHGDLDEATKFLVELHSTGVNQ